MSITKLSLYLHKNRKMKNVLIGFLAIFILDLLQLSVLQILISELKHMEAHLTRVKANNLNLELLANLIMMFCIS